MGQGKTTVKPDLAIVRIGIDVIAKSLSEANHQANTQMQKILSLLKRAGVAERDLQTSGYHVQIERPYDPRTGPGEISGYRITHQVQAKIRALDKVGAILEQVVSAGANNVGGIELTVEDPTPHQARALSLAYAAARLKAEQLAKSAGVQLGAIRQISESSTGDGPIRPMRMDAMRAEAAAPPVPVETGELEFTADVQVVYAIR